MIAICDIGVNFLSLKVWKFRKFCNIICKLYHKQINRHSNQWSKGFFFHHASPNHKGEEVLSPQILQLFLTLYTVFWEVIISDYIYTYIAPKRIMHKSQSHI